MTVIWECSQANISHSRSGHWAQCIRMDEICQKLSNCLTIIVEIITNSCLSQANQRHRTNACEKLTQIYMSPRKRPKKIKIRLSVPGSNQSFSLPSPQRRSSFSPRYFTFISFRPANERKFLLFFKIMLNLPSSDEESEARSNAKKKREKPNVGHKNAIDKIIKACGLFSFWFLFYFFSHLFIRLNALEWWRLAAFSHPSE